MKRSYLLLFLLIGVILSIASLANQSTDNITSENSSELNITIASPVAVETWGWNDMFDPEIALGHGIQGYVNVSYVTTPPGTTIVSPGKSIDYVIEYTLIPYVENLTETIIVLDPIEGPSGGRNGVNFNEYVSYKPNVFLLSHEEPVEVMMTYSVPGDHEHGFSAPRDYIIGVGMHSVLPVKGGHGGGWSRRVDLDWANTLIENNMSVMPAWFMISRYEFSSPLVTIMDVESIDFELYPKIREAFDIELKGMNHYRPEWVACSSRQGVELVELLDMEIGYRHGDYSSWNGAIRYQGQNYSLSLIFSKARPVTD